MGKKIKIYLKFLICFIICMSIYILSTYLKNFTRNVFEIESKYWTIQFIFIVLISLLNGVIFERINENIIKHPEQIFKMMSHLILQLYSFSIILLYIVLVVSGITDQNSYLLKENFELNTAIFLIYVAYLLINKRRKKEKYTMFDGVKVFIGASIIFQSSVAELLFLGIYLVLLALFTKSNVLYRYEKKVTYIVGIAILILEVSILFSTLNWLNKIILSITNFYIIYVGKVDYDYLKKYDKEKNR